MLSALSLLVSLSAPSFAKGDAWTEAPWRWEAGQVRRFYVESRVRLPTVLELYAEKSVDVAVGEWEDRVLLRCTATGHPGEVQCVIEDITLTATAVDGEHDHLAQILQEMDGDLTGGVIDLKFRPDGRLVAMDLQNNGLADRRDAKRHDDERNIILRAMAGFDLQLPDEDITSEWKQSQSRLADYPSAYGSQNRTTIKHQRAMDEDALMRVDSEGTALVAVNIEIPGGLTQSYNVTSDIASVAQLEPGTNELRFRSWLVSGGVASNASSFRAVEEVDDHGSVLSRSYLQTGLLIALPQDAPNPALGLTEVDTYEASGPGEHAVALATGAPIGDILDLVSQP